MSKIFHFTLSIITLGILALLPCNNPKKIRIQYIFQLLTIEIVLAYFCLNTQIGLKYTKYFVLFFNKISNFTEKGTNFVFGNMNQQELAFFFLNVLCPIILVSALIGIFKYIHIIPIAIKILGTILSKISGMGKLESFNAISSLILGQSENFILYKNILQNIPKERIYTMAVTAMSTVSLSIIGAYITILTAQYVITALILNIFSTFIILSISNPYQIDETNDSQICILYDKQQNFFEMLNEYILIGFKIVAIISAMLIGFIALISAIDDLFNILFDINCQTILSYLFIPIAWIIGISPSETFYAGNIIAIKLFSNEFVAMLELQKTSNKLSHHSIGTLSIFLVSFANFSSIGIIVGAISGINKKQGQTISKYGFKLIYHATLINLLSATIAALVL